MYLKETCVIQELLSLHSKMDCWKYFYFGTGVFHVMELLKNLVFFL